MKKKILLLTSLSSTLVIGSLAAVIGLGAKADTTSLKATDDKSITWTKDTGATAQTSLGNNVTLVSRYDGEWTFGGDYFASSVDKTNSFIDNITDVDSPIQSIKAITVNYTGDNPLYLKIFVNKGYHTTNCCYVSSVVSGTRYEIGVSPEFDYAYCDASDTFRWFYLNHSSGTTYITSLTIEYTCS